MNLIRYHTNKKKGVTTPPFQTKKLNNNTMDKVYINLITKIPIIKLLKFDYQINI